VTGVAGFVGFHVAKRLLADGHAVVGIDNLNAYYDPALKEARLEQLRGDGRFAFHRMDICDEIGLAAVFSHAAPRYVVHLAAQAGVRHSIEAPMAYASANLTGFLNVLERCRHTKPEHLLYASSSSVYGGNASLPYSVSQPVDHPVSLYAATKKANELMAHTYSHLYGLPATGLRFFTVYGPWGRPDMAYWKFTEAILTDRPIEIFNHGRMKRDFTWIGDIVEAIVALLRRPATPDADFDAGNPDPGSSWAPHRVYNLGASRPEPLLDMIDILEGAIGKRARRQLLPMQPGDVTATAADIAPLTAATGWKPSTPLAKGLPEFVAWYRDWQAAKAR
jgi:UDP-glucuronate 4-epimerase